MNNQIFERDSSYASLRSRNRWIETFYILGLLLIASLLMIFHLGNLPLTAEEILVVENALQSSDKFVIFPLLPRLISLSYALNGHVVNAWTTRLPLAILTALSVPLLYSLTGELYAMRRPKILISLMYLTTFPVVCSGRLANLTGVSLFVSIWTIGCLLRSRRNLIWSIGIGLGLGLSLLTDGIIFLILFSIILLFLYLDTPRLLTSLYFWIGVSLGVIPVFFGHVPSINFHTSIAILIPYKNSWRSLLDIIGLSLPWLVFWFSGLKFALNAYCWSWSKLILSWLTTVFTFVLLIGTRMPYLAILSIPAFSLAGGTILAEVMNWPSVRPYPLYWKNSLSVLSILASASCILIIYKTLLNPSGMHQMILVIFAASTVTLILATILIAKRDQQFIAILFWGMYLVLLLLLNSSYWTILI